jgi:hypothetical protein
LSILAWDSGVIVDTPLVDRVYMSIGPVGLSIEGRTGERLLAIGGISTGS